MASALRFCAAGMLMLQCAACTTPGQQFDNYANQLGLSRTTVDSDQFVHAVYFNDVEATRSTPLHVYFGGDGSPWIGHVPAADPTARDPLTLALLRADPAPAVMIGRPCYHGLATQTRCEATLWTSGRYSPVVVASLVAAIKSLRAEQGEPPVVLIGFSGGGVLAYLVALKLDNVSALITIGANLDTDAWTQHHGYSPLSGSLNPARAASLRDDVRQLHFFGELDTVVPHGTTRAFFERHSLARAIEVAGYSHACCWAERWPELLRNSQIEPANVIR